MPNGNLNLNEREFPKSEKFFCQFSKNLEDFAERHNLLIDKYWHQFYSWRFSFKHPKGGIAALELFKENGLLMQIYSYWWIDDYEKFTRFARRSQSKYFEAEIEIILQNLEENFFEILSWKTGEWTDLTKEFKGIWNKYSKEEFYKLNDKYPVPRF